jgi:hypothetical protein
VDLSFILHLQLHPEGKICNREEFSVQMSSSISSTVDVSIFLRKNGF